MYNRKYMSVKKQKKYSLKGLPSRLKPTTGPDAFYVCWKRLPAVYSLFLLKVFFYWSWVPRTLTTPEMRNDEHYSPTRNK